jgi:hypothetical protein
MLLIDHFGDFFVDEFVQRGRALAVEVQMPAAHSKPHLQANGRITSLNLLDCLALRNISEPRSTVSLSLTRT